MFKITSLVVLLLLVGGFGYFLGYKNGKAIITKDVTTTEVKASNTAITGSIITNTLEVIDGKTIGQFKINAIGTNTDVKYVYLWTESTKPQKYEYTEFISVPMNSDRYIFAQFLDKNGVSSPIYADSIDPIYQTEKLAE